MCRETAVMEKSWEVGMVQKGSSEAKRGRTGVYFQQVTEARKEKALRVSAKTSSTSYRAEVSVLQPEIK